MTKKFKPDECDWSDELTIMIPRVGTHIQLIENWTFRLYNEYRNSDAFNLFGLKRGNGYHEVILLSGTVLKVDRVYIKKESGVGTKGLNRGGEYNSLTFRLVYAPDDLVLIDALSGTTLALKKGKKPRFFAKLADVNKIKGRIDVASMATY